MLELNQVHQGHCLDLLGQLPTGSIHATITSPPYFGLRDYGTDPVPWPAVSFAPMAGLPEITIPEMVCSLGLEPDLWAYVGHLVAVFREVKRVLRDDGVCWINLGDSYFSNSSGISAGASPKSTLTGGGGRYRKGSKAESMWIASNAQRATSCDTFDTKLEDYQERGCLCESLCGECRGVYLHKFHTCDLLVPKLIASLSGPTRVYMESEFGHFPTSGLILRAIRILDAIRDYRRLPLLEVEQILSSQESTLDEFSRLLLVECWQRGNSSACLACARSLADDAQEFSCMTGDFGDISRDNLDISLSSDQLAIHNRNRDKACEYCKSYNRPSTYIIPQNPLKPKDLMGIPWRVAFALQADGWWLRLDVIWAKLNPMPESVTDRPTKAHEYVFLLAKSEKYYFDQEAIREPLADESWGRMERKQDLIDKVGAGTLGKQVKNRVEQSHSYAGLALARNGKTGYNPAGRNRRSVWAATEKPPYETFQDWVMSRLSDDPETYRGLVDEFIALQSKFSDVLKVANQPYPGSHFATFPPRLIEPMVLAAPGEVCGNCGAPLVRVVENESMVIKRSTRNEQMGKFGRTQSSGTMVKPATTVTTGWRPSCACDAPTTRAVILDPFFGSGTVGEVAIANRRNFIGFELNPDYAAELVTKRLDGTQIRAF